MGEAYNTLRIRDIRQLRAQMIKSRLFITATALMFIYGVFS